MMIENYYKILSLPANVERYKVACRYKHLSVKYFKTRRNQTDDDIYQINRAFEILRNEDLRKYYLLPKFGKSDK